jgi:hypothetical protein
LPGIKSSGVFPKKQFFFPQKNKTVYEKQGSIKIIMHRINGKPVQPLPSWAAFIYTYTGGG